MDVEKLAKKQNENLSNQKISHINIFGKRNKNTEKLAWKKGNISLKLDSIKFNKIYGII